MWTRRARAGVTASALLGASMVLAPTAASAQVDPQVVQVVSEVGCGQVEFTLTNLDVGAYGFTFTIGPFDGGPAGESGRIDVAAGATVSRVVELPEDSFGGRGFVTLGVAFGPNTFKQPFVDLGLVDTDCEDTPPVTTVAPTPAPTSTTVAAPPDPTATTPATATSTVAPTLPPAPDDDVNCGDVTAVEAQAILDADPTDPNRLDGDGDGVACNGADGDLDGDGTGDFDQIGGRAPVGSVATGA